MALLSKGQIEILKAMRRIGEPATAARIGYECWGKSYRKPQDYARPAWRVLSTLFGKKEVKSGYEKGHTLWAIAVRGNQTWVHSRRYYRDCQEARRGGMKVYLARVTGKAVEIFSTLEKAREYAAVSPPAEIRIAEYTVDEPSPENGKVVEHIFID